MKRITNLFLLPAEKKGISLNLNTEENIYVFGDREMINAVIRNLLHNAIKYSSSGGRVDLEIKEDSGLVKLSVTDQGVGISETNLKKLFNLASKCTSYGTHGEKGTGLGLIISKEFIEKNGGKIQVESKLNEGSTFGFYMQAGQINDR